MTIVADKHKPHQAGHFKDARGRKVALLDPVTMRLLRRHGVIPAETLGALADEIGVGWSKKVRVLFLISVVCLGLFVLVTLLGVIADVIEGPGFNVPVPVLAVLPSMWVGPWLMWMGARAARSKRIHRVMLEHRRCPHCGYDLRLLPTDPADGATVCPECGCAWMLDAGRNGGGQSDE